MADNGTVEIITAEVETATVLTVVADSATIGMITRGLTTVAHGEIVGQIMAEVVSNGSLFAAGGGAVGEGAVAV